MELVVTQEDGFGEHTLSEIGFIVRGIGEFKRYFRAHEGVEYDQRCDWDGQPHDEVFTISRHNDKLDKDSWRVEAIYHATYGAARDYERRGNVGQPATAFKKAGPSSYKTVGFKIHSARLIVSDDEAIEHLRNDIQRLANRTAEIRASVLSLSRWADAGLDMAVVCSNGICGWAGGRSVIPAATLKEYARRGSTLETFRKRLTCKRCGRRSSSVYPV